MSNKKPPNKSTNKSMAASIRIIIVDNQIVGIAALVSRHLHDSIKYLYTCVSVCLSVSNTVALTIDFESLK